MRRMLRGFFALAGGGLFAIALLAPVQARAAGEAVTGTPVEGALGVSHTVSDIMRLQAQSPARTIDPEDMEKELEQPDRSKLPQAPGALASPTFPPLPPGVSPVGDGITPFSPQTVGTSFTGATLSGVNPTLSFPPDNMGAVGPTQYVVFVNGRLVTFNKATGVADGVLNADPDVFFSSVVNGSFTSDPRIRYDRLTGRWFMVIINVSTPNRILLAVSDGANNGTISAATVFRFFFIDIATTPPAISNTCLADYPTLGLDANALYIGTNNFCGSPSQTYNSSDGYVVRKSSILGAGPIVVTVFRGLVATSASDGPYTPQGVDNYDPAATEGYFIGVSNAAFGQLNFRRISNPGGTPSVSADIPITVTATNFPVLVPHLGNTGGNNGRLSSLDDRLFAAHIRNGRLWTAHNIGVNNTGVSSGTLTRNGSRWYELNVPAGAGTPTVVQSGTVFTPSATNLADQRSYWVPSVMVSGQGHAALGFSTAGSAERANAATVGRLSSDAAGTMETPVLFTSSSTAYNPPSDPGSAGVGRRWGDYTYTSLDPLDDMTMWTVQMFCDAANSYGVRVAKLIPPPPATPSSVPNVTAGANPVNVTLTGLSVSGSGFYDPGANLPGVVPFNHLAVAITNGTATGTPPTVVSATYVNPTTVNLVLNASAATANVGAENYTVTVTNPDGQTTAAAVLHVVGGSPVASIAAGPSQNEGNAGTSAFTFTVNLSQTSGSPVTVNWATSDGTATTADLDYVAGSGVVTIPAGQLSGTFAVTVNGDLKYENNETFTATLSSPSGATLGTATSTGTILNDDAQPTVSVSDVSQAEGNAGTSPMVFTLSLSAPSGLPASVNWSTSDLTATVADGDYASASGTANFPAGATTAQATVTLNGDTKFEANETFRVSLASPSGATLGTATATGTLTNDDTAPVLTLAAGPSNLEGNAGTTPFVFTASLSAISGLPVTASWQTSDGTATTADGDYASGSGTLTIPAGQTSGTITVNGNGDTTNEADETFDVTLSSPGGATLGVPASATGTIRNDDGPPTLSIGNVSQAEGDAGTSAFVFDVTLSAASGLPVTVDFATADGSATVANNDYVAALGSLTFPAGTTSRTVAVDVNGDVVFEGDETFVVNLTNLAGATAGTMQGTGTITNDDAAPALSVNDGSVAEGNAGATVFTFTVSLSATSSQPVSVDVATADGTATSGSGDFAAGSGTLTIPANTLSATFDVSVNGDLCGEPDETFSVVLSNPSGATIADGSGTGTITNDDDVVAPTVAVVSPNGGEVLTQGTNATLQWTAGDDVAVSSVTIELSRDGGLTYPEVLASGLPNTGSYEWTVTGPGSATTATCFVRVTAFDAGCNRTSDVSDAAFRIEDFTTAVPVRGPITAFALGVITPNPTTGSCHVNFDLPREAAVRLSVVDLQGRELALLASRTFGAGRWQAAWNGQTPRGPAPAGVYFMRYQVAGRNITRRLVLAK